MDVAFSLGLIKKKKKDREWKVEFFIEEVFFLHIYKDLFWFIVSVYF